ncbi:MAG: rRNA maturation RNase YbeY [Eubacteriales bacterium]|nr:rRNA maturation RNase YbeY [Eubacteriales bacterium]
MTINIEYETKKPLGLDYELIIKEVVNEAVDYEKCPYEAEVNVILTDNETIHEINKEHRKVDSATDVLSFPMIEYNTPADFESLEEDMNVNTEDYFNPESGELMLGDIVISVEKVLEQAEKYGHSPKRELAFLVAHSMMHLFGYDHIEDTWAQVMEKKQNEVLQHLGINR